MAKGLEMPMRKMPIPATPGRTGAPIPAAWTMDTEEIKIVGPEISGLARYLLMKLTCLQLTFSTAICKAASTRIMSGSIERGSSHEMVVRAK